MPKIPMRSFTGPTDGTVVVGPDGTLVTASSGGPVSFGSSTEAGLPGTASPGSVSYLTDKGTLAFRTSTGWQKAIAGSGVLIGVSGGSVFFAPEGSGDAVVPLPFTDHYDETTYIYDMATDTITVNVSGHYVVAASWRFRTSGFLNNVIRLDLVLMANGVPVLSSKESSDNFASLLPLTRSVTGAITLNSGDVLQWKIFRWDTMAVDYGPVSRFFIKRVTE